MLSLNRRTAFITLWAMAAMKPSQSTFHNPRRRERAQPSRSSEAKASSTVVWRRLISLRNTGVWFRSPCSEVEWVVHAQRHVPALLIGWETLGFDRASLTVVLPGNVLVDFVPVMESTTLESFPMRANQMITAVCEASLRHHVGLLIRVDRDISSNATLIQEASQTAGIVGSVRP